MMGILQNTNFSQTIAKPVALVRTVYRRAAPYLTGRNIALAAGGALALLALAGTAAFLVPRSVAFSYSGATCLTHPTVLPGLITKNHSDTYRAEPVASLSVAGYPLYAHSVCITPIQAPAEHSGETLSFGTALVAKRITVTTDSFPSLANGDALDAPIPAREPLTLELDKADRVFDYRLRANGHAADCTKQDHELICDVAELNLKQSETYDFTLKRLFDGEIAQAVFERPLETVESVVVAESSIEHEQTVYDAPEALTLTMNRAVATADDAQLQFMDEDAPEQIPITAVIDEETVTVQFDEPLPRQASFEFVIEDIRAADGGFLSSPFAITFETSGGPQVQGVNIGHNRVPRGGNIVLTFDAAVSTEQDLAEFIRLEASSNNIAASIHVNGRTLTISPHSTLPRCAPLTVRILDGLENEHGISGGSAWHINSRTLCQVVSRIGTSVQGRAITSYSFGTGSSIILFVGGVHGNEKSSVHTLNSWINELENNPGRIPSHRRIVVVPNANPDGFAADTRNNANNVDLNRNFNTFDWKSDVTFGDGTHNPTGGGTAPLSEPESKALASYTLSLNPRMVLTYHSIAGYVIPNDAGDSDAVARSYANASNLRYASHAQTGEIFPYDTTGAYEDWLHDRHGLPALLLELWTRAGNEFAGNRDAMWRMVNL